MTSLDEYALANETPIRLGWFLLVFALVGALEALRPRRSRMLTRLSRWPHNLTLVALNVLVLRVLFPFAAIAMAGSDLTVIGNALRLRANLRRRRDSRDTSGTAGV